MMCRLGDAFECSVNALAGKATGIFIDEIN